MANRHADWLRQAEADVRHASNSLQVGDYEWACFAAQQGAEKAVKAVVQALGGEPSGHKHYIPARYPNGFDAGAPTDYYTRPEAEAAIADAQRILEPQPLRLPRPLARILDRGRPHASQ